MSNTVYEWELHRADKRGLQWAFNRDNISQLCYAYARAEGLMRFSKIVRTTQKVNFFRHLKPPQLMSIGE